MNKSFNNARDLLSIVFIKLSSMLTVLVIPVVDPFPYGAGTTPGPHLMLHFAPLTIKSCPGGILMNAF